MIVLSKAAFIYGLVLFIYRPYHMVRHRLNCQNLECSKLRAKTNWRPDSWFGFRSTRKLCKRVRFKIHFLIFDLLKVEPFRRVQHALKQSYLLKPPTGVGDRWRYLNIRESWRVLHVPFGLPTRRTRIERPCPLQLSGGQAALPWEHRAPSAGFKKLPELGPLPPSHRLREGA